MNNFKKIGMTALAASLVSTSVFAGELAVTGSASMTWSYKLTHEQHKVLLSFLNGKPITFSGSGELDNGMTVALSFRLDQDDERTSYWCSWSSLFDAHSVTISSDALGTLVFAGEGGDLCTMQ